MKEKNKLFLMVLGFLAIFYLPLSFFTFRNPFFEAIYLVREYAREHILFCLVPAFFIAGAIAVFINKASIIRYFGPKAKKILAYSVASVSGTILAVCSCTVLPLFSSIYKKGAGLGPAITFLYSGPAINVLAIVMTAQVLGWQLGLARALGSVVFSVVIGLLMHFIFLKEERKRESEFDFSFIDKKRERRGLLKNGFHFLFMAGFLVFANWVKPEGASQAGFIYSIRWYVAAAFLILTGVCSLRWFDREELSGWVSASWGFAKQIMPVLFLGVALAGLLLGRPGQEGFIPSQIIERAVGGNSLAANFFAAIVGAFMYFATITEVPILEGLIGSGMGRGPALALLLSGPAVSLPSMMVVSKVIGVKKTMVYAGLVVIVAACSGVIFGIF